MSLFHYYGLLREKQEQFQRLQNCHNQLQEIKQEFWSFRKSVVDPELSPATWQGSLADRFNDIRTEGIFHFYQDIESNQLTHILSTIRNQTRMLQNEIESIQQIIHSLELQMLEE
ncbi:YwqH-like family protein [Metabacillus iocasae]|uniref:DUF5082 domain-containing protein n=1 Tax=Priestia iocasae TaxID=2291674 RepID=A0ABS2QY27_9BACI|nr:DUF5082 family protein [Metabacillus iocasae]MBM7704394.1 hypothetical protein [Metabacillus iocasae]